MSAGQEYGRRWMAMMTCGIVLLALGIVLVGCARAMASGKGTSRYLLESLSNERCE